MYNINCFHNKKSTLSRFIKIDNSEYIVHNNGRIKKIKLLVKNPTHDGQDNKSFRLVCLAENNFISKKL